MARTYRSWAKESEYGSGKGSKEVWRATVVVREGSYQDRDIKQQPDILSRSGCTSALFTHLLAGQNLIEQRYINPSILHTISWKEGVQMPIRQLSLNLVIGHQFRGNPLNDARCRILVLQYKVGLDIEI